MPDACQYEAIAFSTWPEQHTVLMASVLYQRCPGQKYILLVHNPDFLLQPPPGQRTLPLAVHGFMLSQPVLGFMKHDFTRPSHSCTCLTPACCTWQAWLGRN